MNVHSRRRRPGELVFAYLLLLFSLFLFHEAYKISGFSSVSSAGVFPLVATGLMIVTSLVTIVRTHRMQSSVDSEESLPRAFWRQITPVDLVVFVAITVLYALALDPLGFLSSSFLFLTASIFYLHERRIVVSVVVALISLALIYLVFRVAFEVVLPKGWMFQ